MDKIASFLGSIMYLIALIILIPSHTIAFIFLAIGLMEVYVGHITPFESNSIQIAIVSAVFAILCNTEVIRYEANNRKTH